MDFKKEKGFSLVEMAVVLTIVGVVIAGVLSIGEMISNAEVTQSISSLENYKSATASFRTKYKSLPGDMIDATTRVNNCDGGNNCEDGDGNSIIGDNNAFRTTLSGGPTDANDIKERWLFWKHLAMNDMIEDISISDDGTEEGTPFLAIGAVIAIGSSGGANSNCGIGSNFPAGIWAVAVPNLTRSCTNNQAMPKGPIKKIDLKIDDGMPNEGNVRAGGSGANCTSTSGGREVYNVAEDGSCSMAYRIRK